MYVYKDGKRIFVTIGWEWEVTAKCEWKDLVEVVRPNVLKKVDGCTLSHVCSSTHMYNC